MQPKRAEVSKDVLLPWLFQSACEPCHLTSQVLTATHPHLLPNASSPSDCPLGWSPHRQPGTHTPLLQPAVHPAAGRTLSKGKPGRVRPCCEPRHGPLPWTPAFLIQCCAPLCSSHSGSFQSLGTAGCTSPPASPFAAPSPERVSCPLAHPSHSSGKSELRPLPQRSTPSPLSNTILEHTVTASKPSRTHQSSTSSLRSRD